MPDGAGAGRRRPPNHELHRWFLNGMSVLEIGNLCGMTQRQVEAAIRQAAGRYADAAEVKVGELARRLLELLVDRAAAADGVADG
jgi:hypothetical protein